MKYEALRKEITTACQEMNRRGINQGTSGNISVRVKEGFLLTPSGIAYDEMKPADIVLMKPDATHEGKCRPSSEWRFHHALMTTRPEVGAVVHTHAMFATTLSCLGMEIPAVHYMVAAAGGHNIRCAPYATFGTQETADNAVKALKDRNACLLANHGMIAVGPTLEKAMWLASELETLARQYYHSLLIGGPVILSDDQIEETRQAMTGYGVQDKTVRDKAAKGDPARGREKRRKAK